MGCDLGGVEAAVDVHERAALGVGEAAGVGEAQRDFAVATGLTAIWLPYTIYPMKTTKTTVYLNAADYRKLKSLAADQGRSAAELVREAVAEYAARATEREWPRSIGIMDSGDPHFAENYEDYLDGFGEDGLEDYFASLEADRAPEDAGSKPHGRSE